MATRLKHLAQGSIVSVDDAKVDALVASGVFAHPTSEPSGSISPYASMKVDELKAEIESRNEGRGEADLLSLEGKKVDLISTLDADDAAPDDE